MSLDNNNLDLSSNITALPGMGAGGVADPIQGDSEEYGASAPRKERVGDDEASESTAGDDAARPTTKRQKTGDVDVSGSKKGVSSSGAKSSSGQSAQGSDELEQISHEKAEKYGSLDEDEVDISTASTEQGKREARASRRADALGESKATGSDEAKKHGGHADVEELHGKATTQGSGNGSGKKRSNEESQTGNSGESAQEEHEGDQVQRHQAEKFGSVNLEE